MKAFILSTAFLLVVSLTQAQDASKNQPTPDSIKLHVEGNMAYYQKTFRVDSNIKISTIYLRALQFMAAKNFQQNYGYEQEGKMIFTTTQDLNSTPASVEPNEDMQPYTVQFAITVDMKNSRYRCTISNITFYMPTDYGNRRMTLYDVYEKETSGESRRITKNARTLRESFERYLISLTNELYAEVEHKEALYNSKF